MIGFFNTFSSFSNELLFHLTWVVKLRQALRLSSRFYHEGTRIMALLFSEIEDRGKIRFEEGRLRVQLLTWHIQDAALICFHIINFPKTLYLKTANIYYLVDSVSQELGSSISGWFWLRVSHKVALRISAGAAVLCEGLLGAGRPTFQDGALTLLMVRGLISSPCGSPQRTH